MPIAAVTKLEAVNPPILPPPIPPPPETEVKEEDMEEDDVAFPVPDAGDPALPIDMTSLCAAYKGAAAAEA